jgi:hypothetical protein
LTYRPTWVRILTLCCPLLGVAGCGYSSRQAGPYHAAEHGHNVRLFEVGVRDNGNPFDTFTTHLLEPCEGRQGVTNSVPCWPLDERYRTRKLLESLKCDTLRIPWYRGREGLLGAAESLNRDFGPGGHAYVIGTEPFAFAVLDERPELLAIAREMTRVQPVPERGRGTRTASFVADRDMPATVNVVLVYTQGTGSEIGPSPNPEDLPRAALFVLRQAEPLSRVIDALAESGGLARLAEMSLEVPVRLY